MTVTKSKKKGSLDMIWSLQKIACLTEPARRNSLSMLNLLFNASISPPVFFVIIP